MGGRGVKPVEEFDPAAKTWRKLEPTPLEIHHFQPVVYRDRVYVMTAMTGAYPKETPLETIYIYDPNRDSWQKGPEGPESRRRGGAGTVAYNGKVYLVGGIIDGHTSGTVAWFDEFDPTTGKWTQLPDAPRIRGHFSAIVSGDRLYYLGGRNTSYHEPEKFSAFFGVVISEVDVYDFSTGLWSTLPNTLPTPTAAGGIGRAGWAHLLYWRRIRPEARSRGNPAPRSRNWRMGTVDAYETGTPWRRRMACTPKLRQLKNGTVAVR